MKTYMYKQFDYYGYPPPDKHQDENVQSVIVCDECRKITSGKCFQHLQSIYPFFIDVKTSDEKQKCREIN
jgi:hypothetical protein